jgi:ammonium transporter Rh
MFWPSFNGALATGNSQHRVIVNTVLALTASCMGTFLTSSLFSKGKFNMEHVLNATLAGGVIIGSSSDLVVDCVFSILIGFLGGAASTVGFEKLNPCLWEKCGIHDTCGVMHLHGIPGILGGIIGGITAGVTGDVVYG